MKRKALVVDDDIHCLNIIAEYLGDKQFKVSAHRQPLCPMLEQNAATCPMQIPCYNFILSDYHMPEMTGLEFFKCQKLRGCKIPDRCKALISGAILETDQTIAESMGYKVFHKPTPLKFIDRWIEEISD